MTDRGVTYTAALFVCLWMPVQLSVCAYVCGVQGWVRSSISKLADVPLCPLTRHVPVVMRPALWEGNECRQASHPHLSARYPSSFATAPAGEMEQSVSRETRGERVIGQWRQQCLFLPLCLFFNSNNKTTKQIKYRKLTVNSKWFRNHTEQVESYK